MKVVQIINQVKIGGGELVAINAHKELQKNNIDSMLFAVRFNKDLRNVIKKLKINESDIRELKYDRLGPRNILNLISGSYSFLKGLDKNNKTILHSHCELPDIFLIFVKTFAKFLGYKQIIFVRTAHNERYYGLSFGVKIEKFLNIFFDKIIAISSRTFKNNNTRLNAHLIYNPVRLNEINTIERETKIRNKIGVIGRLCKQKNQIALIEKLMLDEYKNKEFYFYGFNFEDLKNERFYPDIQEKINIKICGFESDINKILSSVDLVVIPSLWEGLSTIMVESIYSGTMVHSFDVSGVEDLEQMTGLKIKFDNWDRLINETNEIEITGVKPKLQKEFSSASYYNEIMKVYDL